MTTNLSNKERLIQEIDSLSEALIDEALDFVVFIKARHQQPVSRSTSTDKHALIQAIQAGKYAHASNTSDDFARRKQAEIDWEDRHR